MKEIKASDLANVTGGWAWGSVGAAAIKGLLGGGGLRGAAKGALGAVAGNLGNLGKGGGGGGEAA